MLLRSTEYRLIHYWIRKEKGNPGPCEKCGKEKSEWANVSGKYMRDTSDWIPLCRPCHRKYDHPDREEGSTCKNGHAWNKENVYVRKNGWKECRECKRASLIKFRSKKGNNE